VLDPFCGAATTLVTAISLGRNAVGIDLSEDYTAMSEARLSGSPHAYVPRRSALYR